MARGNTNNSVTRDVTVVHFLLMFGYKLFSAFFPLFLLSRHFSLPQVAWAYLLIYLPIAVFAPLVAFWARKTNPALLMALGICGYAIYALMMIFDGYNLFFYFWQLMLGVSAALFFTASRILLVGHPLKIVERGFSWFYNAPIWADMVAPAIGAYLLWRTNFPVIFSISFGILMLAVIYNLRLWNAASDRGAQNFTLRECFNNWKMLFSKLVDRKTALPIFLSFAMLWQAGLYAAFFVIFLKNKLAWDKNEILIFVPLAAVVFSLFYVVAIKPRQKDKNESSIIGGSSIMSLASLFFALPLVFLNFWSMFIIDFVQNVGAFVCASGRSALVTRRLGSAAFADGRPPVNLSYEAGALDTMFSPLGTALGSLTAGLLVGPLGYQGLFFFGGAAVLVIAIAVFILNKRLSFPR
jgi:MFS family permease